MAKNSSDITESGMQLPLTLSLGAGISMDSFCVCPSNVAAYNYMNESVNAAIFSGAAVKPISFRLHNMEGAYIPVTARCFVQCDSKGNPEYFGGKLVLQ